MSRLVGASVPRVEDKRILTGRGHFVDDLNLPGMLHAAFVRSPLPHARIERIDVTEARKAPGVVAAYTGADFAAITSPIEVVPEMGSALPSYAALPTDKVRFVGDLVAMVVAGSRYEAEDAAELVDVEYDPLPSIASYDDALATGAPMVFEEHGSNVAAHSEMVFGDVDATFASADRVIDVMLSQHRVINVPMETRGAVADYDPGSGELTVTAATQSPQGLRILLSSVLNHPLDRLRVLAADVGGGFGLKSSAFREDFCVAGASKLLGRPVKWIEDRNEHLVASGHGREEQISVQAAVNDDGTLLGIKARMLMNMGAYPAVPFPASLFSGLISMLLPGPYRVQAYSFESDIVFTNKAVYVAYRGPWAMETWTRERLLDIIAHELGLDPADVRRRNLVDGGPDDRLITGMGLHGISSRESLERALELIGYDEFRAEQAEARAQGRCVGVGFATFIEAAPGPTEFRAGGGLFGGERAKASLEADGTLVVTTAQSPHGQSHETTLAQIAADEMGVPFEQVKVVYGDTRQTPFSIIGTGGSRASTWASGAVLMSTRAVKKKVLAIAAAMLEISADDLEIVEGQITPRGVPQKAIPLAQIARQATLMPVMLPPGVDTALESHERFVGEGITGSGWSGGTHVCKVEIDLDTGRVLIPRYIVVEDCGRVINPAVVEGQIRGGVAQGIGEVLYEHAVYDGEANFLAGTFMDYLLPTSSEIPTIEIDHLETDPDGEFGFRGVGEGGTIVAPACVTNAIEDALLPYGARVTHQYLPPSQILELAGIVG